MQTIALPRTTGSATRTDRPRTGTMSFWRSLAVAARQTARDLDRAEKARGGFRASAARSD